jgi:hypothetical protein
MLIRRRSDARFAGDCASRCLPTDSPTARWKSTPSRRPARATENVPDQCACTSHWNAAPTVADRQLVRVTHPFHPLFARQLPCVGRRYNRHGERLLLQSDDARIWPVPPHWTDLVSQDPEIVMGQGRMLLRVADLLELCALVQHLSGQAMARRCKDNYAAHVRRITPHGDQNEQLSPL